MRQYHEQDDMFQHIGVISGMERVTITQHVNNKCGIKKRMLHPAARKAETDGNIFRHDAEIRAQH
jgi:hypothetical protein